MPGPSDTDSESVVYHQVDPSSSSVVAVAVLRYVVVAAIAAWQFEIEAGLLSSEVPFQGCEESLSNLNCKRTKF